MYEYLSEKCTSSQEPEEVSWAASFSDIPASVPSRLNLTAEKSSSKDSEMGSCPNSPSGMMSEHSTESHGEDLSMSSAEDSRVKTSAKQGNGLDWKASAADYGRTSYESLAKYCQKSHSLRTRQGLLFEDSTEFWQILPDWGMMRSGECWEVLMPGPPIRESECGFSLPTPLASDGNGGGRNQTSAKGHGASDNLKDYMSIVHRWLYVPVSISEWLMGWPIGWTDLKPLEMDKFQQWYDSHGKP